MPQPRFTGGIDWYEGYGQRHAEDGAEGRLVSTGDQVTALELLEALPSLGDTSTYDDICDQLEARTDGERAAAIEFALEGLYLARRIGKDTDDDGYDDWTGTER